MKKLIVIGKNSEIAKQAIESLKEKYEEIMLISLNQPDDWCFEEVSQCSYDVVDFNVAVRLSAKKTYQKLFDRIGESLNRYIFVSTVMHGKESTLSLSSYRKYKLKQEQWLKDFCEDKLKIIRSPDILDSLTWMKIKDEENIYKLTSFKDKEVVVSGIYCIQLIEAIVRDVEGKEFQAFETSKAYLIASKKLALSVKLRVKSLIIYYVSKSLIFNELRNYFSSSKTNSCRASSHSSVSFFAGGFADLD